MSQDKPAQLAASWVANASAWTLAVREQRIESRRLVTDAAIVQAVLNLRPARVLDLGCGEGWLCRTLTRQGLDVIGVDASRPLVEAAKASGGGDFRWLSYADLEAAVSELGRFDALVCNFSLLEAEIEPLLQILPRLLQPRGRLCIQTLHPGGPGSQPYADGWRLETFDNLSQDFAAPMPWYFRTFESWFAVLYNTGWRLEALTEPRLPTTGAVVSLVLVAAPG